MRVPLRANTPRQRTSEGASVPAPVEGWDAVSPLANMKPTRAVVLDNWFPQPGYIEIRRGYAEHADGMGTDPIETLMVYNGVTSATSKMFSVTGEAFWDITAASAATSTSVTGLTNNRWQWVNFTTSAGVFLWTCNGADDPKHFNGSAWATPSLTGITPADIINVNVHKKRLWFVLKNSTKAGYLAVETIAGAVTTFELGSQFSKGGYLIAMGTWSQDGGSGPDDYAVFISSEGQAVVYKGTDPASSSTWALVGIFDIGRPIGYRCFTKVASDLALVCVDGVLPISRALGIDRGASAQVAITARINNAMNLAARLYRTNFGWELIAYASGTRAILNIPVVENETQHQYVMNTLTGAWCRFTNQNANCWIVFLDKLYFGGNDGVAYRADFGAMDGDGPVEARGQTAYNYFKSPGRLKDFKMLQPLITTDSSTRPALGVSTDFQDNAVLGTPSTSETDSALYDSAIYDTDLYAIESRAVTDWITVSGEGQAASIHFRSATAAPSGDVELKINGFNMIFEVGEYM